LKVWEEEQGVYNDFWKAEEAAARLRD